MKTSLISADSYSTPNPPARSRLSNTLSPAYGTRPFICSSKSSHIIALPIIHVGEGGSDGATVSRPVDQGRVSGHSFG